MQKISWQTLGSYAWQFSILDKSTWQRTEWIILARELISCISFSSSPRADPEPSLETRSILLRITTSYKKPPKKKTFYPHAQGISVKKIKDDSNTDRTIAIRHIVWLKIVRELSHTAYAICKYASGNEDDSWCTFSW